MRGWAFLAIATVSLAACASPQQRAANECASIGLSAFTDCHEHAMDRNAAASAAMMGAGVGLFNSSYQQRRV
jgi:hypothetical protein